jgi:protocatechuate 3,4-dioxygenase alpha subunit
VNASVSPGQTVGPFFHYALPVAGGAELVPACHPNATRLRGRVLDGNGDPVRDALLEIWQPDAEGRVVHESGSLHRDGFTFTGWGRAATDREGRYSFTTIEPGPTEPGRPRSIAMAVFARGLLDRLFTRLYLPGQDDILASDPFFASVPPDRRGTLVAKRDADGLIFDVVLQGPGETVFLCFPDGRDGA